MSCGHVLDEFIITTTIITATNRWPVFNNNAEVTRHEIY